MENLRGKILIAVIGAGECDENLAKTAYEVGTGIAKKDAILVCGGLGGCMKYASKGAKDAGGITIGIIPSYDKSMANEYIDIVIPTGIGHARNVIVTATADAVIAVGGSVGTLSEIAIARKLGKSVIALDSWKFDPAWEDIAGVIRVTNAKEAVEAAMREAMK